MLVIFTDGPCISVHTREKYALCKISTKRYIIKNVHPTALHIA